MARNMWKWQMVKNEGVINEGETAKRGKMVNGLCNNRQTERQRMTMSLMTHRTTMTIVQRSSRLMTKTISTTISGNHSIDR